MKRCMLFAQAGIRNGQMQGYWWFHHCAIQRGYVVSQDTIRQLIKLFYPVGVELRRVRRLWWRHNCNKGPSTLWCMDLYDKLKPHSTAIGSYSGGFNCYVVWVEAYRTNNDLELREHRRSPRCCTCCWRQLESCPFISAHSRGKPVVRSILTNSHYFSFLCDMKTKSLN